MVMLPDARPPEALRLYAIGDVHGCLDHLLAVHDAILRDLARRPVADWRIIHVGDYIDRGPDSAGALRVLARMARDPHVVCLRGNHDQYLIDFLADCEARSFDVWLFNGGETTLADFGLEVGEPVLCGPRKRADLHRALTASLSPEVVSFLDGLPLHARFGDYLFVHAGIRPGVPLVQQTPRDLMWIRDEFHASTADHGAVVVHGHTPVETIEMRPNRIGIDTGAVYGRHLSCLTLEGAGVAALTEDGPEPLLTSSCDFR
jgi:serine/threonine protein phosphatase 1